MHTKKYTQKIHSKNTHKKIPTKKYTQKNTHKENTQKHSQKNTQKNTHKKLHTKDYTQKNGFFSFGRIYKALGSAETLSRSHGNPEIYN